MIHSKKTFILSEESINSYGFRIITAGIDLTDFLKNPVMLRNHTGDAIGFWENIRVEGNALLANPVFSESDPEIQKIAKKVEEGTLKAASIGIEKAVFTRDSKYILEGQELGTVVSCKAYEASIVEFPGNSNALALYDEKGGKIVLGYRSIFDYEQEHLFTNRNQIKMTKETLKLLNLSEDAKATDVHNAIVILLNQKKGIELLNEQYVEERNLILVSTAFTLGKITVEQTEHYKNLLKMDYNNTKKLIDSIPVLKETRTVKDVRVSDLIKKGHNVTLSNDVIDSDPPKDKSKWNLDHYRKFAPNELRQNPELFDELLKAKQ